MIKAMQPLSLEEAKELADDSEGKPELNEYFKKFSKVKKKDVAPFKKELLSLGNHKIKEEYLVKVIDFLPEDASDINKIFTDVSLNDNEIKQILDIVAKYR